MTQGNRDSGQALAVEQPRELVGAAHVVHRLADQLLAVNVLQVDSQLLTQFLDGKPAKALENESLKSTTTQAIKNLSEAQTTSPSALRIWSMSRCRS